MPDKTSPNVPEPSEAAKLVLEASLAAERADLRYGETLLALYEQDRGNFDMMLNALRRTQERYRQWLNRQEGTARRRLYDACAHLAIDTTGVANVFKLSTSESLEAEREKLVSYFSLFYQSIFYIYFFI